MIPAEARVLAPPETREGRARGTLTGTSKARNRARLGRPALLALLATGLLLGNLALRAQTMARGYALSRFEQTLAMTQVEYDRLSLSAAHLRSLERVDEVARVQLGMGEPASAEYVVLASERHDVAPSMAAAAPTAGEGPGLAENLLTRTGDALIGLVSPFVARWFYDIPDSDHPRVRLR